MKLFRSRWGRVLTGVVVLVLLLAAVVVYVGWDRLYREQPQRLSSIRERFAYGSIGSETAQGIPFEIWRVLPELFPQYLPHHGRGGYRALGFTMQQGRDVPVGFSKKTLGFPRVAFNCAACHSGSFRTSQTGRRRVVLTAPATRLDFEGYIRFLIACASDKRFTAGNILKAIERHTDLDAVDKVLYRFAIIPRTRSALRDYRDRFRWTEKRPDWGRGRIDPFNPVKFYQLKIDQDTDHTIGNSDMEPLWQMAKKQGYALHWDGLNDSLIEVVLTGAIGDGATSVTGKPTDKLPVRDLTRIAEYIKQVPAPKYPFPVDRRMAARGKTVFADRCATCHEFGGRRTGKVIPLAEVDTDRHRLDMWTAQAATRYNDFAKRYPYRFKRFRKTNGYASVPLDGVFLRAPYLHNGSVPTVDDLLEPVSRRPKVFYRGYDVVARGALGFIDKGANARREGFRYDTRVPGNSNQGHAGAKYGTDLSTPDKRALVAYLKTR
ncbi:MAG: cytochrome c [Actinomycetota bacterium]|nr:cytochrome c [Actinomycetota bacterium]